MEQHTSIFFTRRKANTNIVKCHIELASFRIPGIKKAF